MNERFCHCDTISLYCVHVSHVTECKSAVFGTRLTVTVEVRLLLAALRAAVAVQQIAVVTLFGPAENNHRLYFLRRPHLQRVGS